ncbi:MAG: DUF1800 domain-containing protein [Candidatus Dormibacteraeota bacterium]|nr:DUF1800 domain-containing protein [Candidatus Dormibacteraeota bacterium]
MSIARSIDPPGELPAATEASPKRRPAINRRMVLGAAALGGAAVGATRLFGIDTTLERLVGIEADRGDWGSPLADEKARVNHLLRRVTFGATAEELDRALGDGFDKTVERIIETPPQKPPEFTLTAGVRLNVPNLQLWWLEHMLKSATPFAERMTLFWHGHFTSDYRKVGVADPFLYWQNLTWREMAMTNLPSMLTRVTTDPAMLRYLDLGTSTGAAPNENYSRELMELFTMGVGNYGEDDVRAAAKGLAGWTLPRPSGSTTVTVDRAGQVTRRFPTYASRTSGVFVPRRAYRGGPYRFLGRTKVWDTEKVLGQILAQPATAVLIARKVAAEFVARTPDDAYVKRLAGQFRSSGYDMKTLLRAVLTSPEFVAEQGYRGLVKSPTEFMVHVLKVLGAPQLARLAVAAAPNLGQVLFDPPDVGGWPSNDAWISSSSVVARVNFVSAVLGNLGSPPSAGRGVDQLDGVFSQSTARLLNQASDEHARWFLALASPEFQLK